MIENIIQSVMKTVKHWWISLLIGVLCIIVGTWCLVTPVGSLVALTWLFILTMILSGIFEIVFGVSNRSLISGWGWSLAKGGLEIILGIFLLSLPTPVVATILIYFVGFWILFASVMSIGESCELHQMGVKGWGWLLALSILSLIFCFIYLMTPLFGGIFLIVFVGMSFVMYGVFRILLAFKFRQINKILKETDF